MPVQIAVGQRAQLLQITEQQPFRVRDERRQHAEPGAFMNHAIQPIIGKTRPRSFLAYSLSQLLPHIHTAARPPPVVDPLRTVYPSPRATMPARRFRRPGKTARQRDTTRRPQTSAAAEIGMRRILPG